MNHVLVEGSSVPLPVPVLRAAVHGSSETGGAEPLELRVRIIPLSADGRALTAGGELIDPSGPQPVRGLPSRRHRDGVMAALEVRFRHFGPAVRGAALLLTTGDTRTPLSAAGTLQLTLWDPAGERALGVLPLSAAPADAALVCGELRVGEGGWEFAVAQRGFPQEETARAVYQRPGTGQLARTPPRPAYHPRYGYPQPDPAFTLPPQGPQFRPGRQS